MKPLEVISAYKLKDTEGILPSDTIYSGYLIGGVEQTVTIPSAAHYCIFSYENNIFVNYDATASVPTGTISQAGGELNPKIRYVGDTTTLHIIAPTGTKISLSFYGK